jgi:hypothetical protein
MLPILILVRPLDLKTGQRVDIRLSSAAEATASGLGGQSWEPAVSRRPRIAQDLMSLDLDGKFKLAAADFVISLNDVYAHINPARLYWPGATVTIWSVAALDWNRKQVEFSGLVTTAPYDRDGRKITINGLVDRDRIDKPLLTKEFNADGAAGGGPEMRGKLYPAGFGYCEDVEWTLFDSVNNIGMLDGYGNLISVAAAMEALSDLGPSAGDWPSYGQLVDATRNGLIPKGRWGTCLAAGMVALGAPPGGRITFNATFGSNMSGAIMRRILKVHAGVADEDVMLGTFDLLDAANPYEVRGYWREQIQCSDAIEAMCWPLNATPLVTVQNKIAVTTAGLSAEISTLNYDASVLPLVTNARSADPLVPIWRVVYRAERPVDVLDYSEVNYVDALIDRGLYNNDETYRQGNLVWLADKSRWLYIWPSPAAGHKPGDPRDAAAPYWQQILNATDATTITYPGSGKTLAELEPAQKGAGVTGQNTAKDTALVAGRSAQQVLDGMDINTMSILGAILNGDQLNQLIQAIGYVAGQPVGNVFLQFKGEQQGKNDSMAYQISLQASKNDSFTASIFNLSQTMTDADKALARTLQELQVSSGSNSAGVKLLMEALITDGNSLANAILRTDADGVTGAFQITSDGARRLSTISLMSDELYFIDRNKNGPPIRALYYAAGNWQLADNLYVRNLFADSVTTSNIRGSAVQQTNVSLLGSDLSVARGSTVNVATINFTKDQGDSLLKMTFNGNFWSQDDLQFTTAFVVDGGVSYPGGQTNIILDSQNSAGRAQISPFYHLQNLAAGPHTVTVSVYNGETDNIPLTVKMGSALEVIEIKKGAK